MKPELQALTPTEKAIILMCEAAPQPLAAIQGVLLCLAYFEPEMTDYVVRKLSAGGLLRREGDGYRATQPLNEWQEEHRPRSDTRAGTRMR